MGKVRMEPSRTPNRGARTFWVCIWSIWRGLQSAPMSQSDCTSSCPEFALRVVSDLGTRVLHRLKESQAGDLKAGQTRETVGDDGQSDREGSSRTREASSILTIRSGSTGHTISSDLPAPESIDVHLLPRQNQAPCNYPSEKPDCSRHPIPCRKSLSPTPARERMTSQGPWKGPWRAVWPASPLSPAQGSQITPLTRPAFLRCLLFRTSKNRRRHAPSRAVVRNK